MKIIHFSEQPLENRCVNLDKVKEAFAGGDSVVYRLGDTAAHVYHTGAYDTILNYVFLTNAAAEALDKNPFTDEVEFEGEIHTVEARINPVTEVGEKMFILGGKEKKQVYTLSPFIAQKSLCYPNRAKNEEQRAVARCFPIGYYEKIEGHISDNSDVRCPDINPHNIKYKVDREQKKILLTITDISNCINIVYGKDSPHPASTWLDNYLESS